MAHDIINEQKKTLIDKKNYNLDNLFYFDILQFIKFYNLRQTIIYPKYNVKKEFTKILKMTKELTFKKNAKLYFVYLPDYQRYKLNNKNKNYSDIVNIVNKLNIPFIDIHQEVFNKEVNPLDLFPFGLYGHYNKEGYYKVADTIFKLTSNQN